MKPTPIVGEVNTGSRVEGGLRNRRNEAMQRQLPMHQSPRCGARTRSRKPCRSPAVSGKVRCRMHGGAAGSGGQPGNANAFKHGRYSAEAIYERRILRALLRGVKATIQALS